MTSSTTPARSLPAVTADIIDLIRVEAPNAVLRPDTALTDCGLDSVRVLSLVLRIETRYAIELDADDSDDLRTVGDLGRLVLHRIEAGS